MLAFDPRLKKLHNWLQQQFPQQKFNMQPIPNDASARRYFRVTFPTQTMIAMDAPPDLETLEPFINKARILQQLHLHVPKIFAQDLKNGFLLLSDLGDDLYFRILNPENFTSLYNLALNGLYLLQTYTSNDVKIIPQYDENLLQQELTIFTTWYVARNHQPLKHGQLDKIFKLLIGTALNQPQVLVHRDYHSRNLLLLPESQLGIIDFQGAVYGPITYDLVSLARDCYIAWPEEKIMNLVTQFYQTQTAKLKNVSLDEFTRWFDWMGLQRHLKVLGIFTRLAVRDLKSQYLADIPRVLNYARTISRKYSEFALLHELLSNEWN